MRKKTGQFFAALFLICFIVSGNFMLTSYSQTNTEEQNQTLIAKRVKKKKVETTFWGLVKQGGLTMFPLGVLSVAAVGLIVYGFIISRYNYMVNPESLPHIEEALLDNLNIEEAANLCENNPCLLTNILYAGIDRIKDRHFDAESMEKAMEEASVEEVSAGMKPINYLSIIAQIAPMLGLLGTVSGMIKAFQKIGLGGMGDAEALATDIGEAMITTATGLIIGIPAMFFYFYLKSKYMGNVANIARLLGNIVHHLKVSVSSESSQNKE